MSIYQEDFNDKIGKFERVTYYPTFDDVIWCIRNGVRVQINIPENGIGKSVEGYFKSYTDSGVCFRDTYNDDDVYLGHEYSDYIEVVRD